MDEFILPTGENQNSKRESRKKLTPSKDVSIQEQQEELELDSNPNNFMGHEHDDTHYCDLVDMEKVELGNLLEGNSKLLQFLTLEGKKLFCSFFLNRRRLRQLAKKNKKRKVDQDSDESESEDDGGKKIDEHAAWKRKAEKKQANQLQQLSKEERLQFQTFPHMPLHSYSLGSGLFVSSAGYKPYPNSAHQHIKLGRMTFSNQSETAQGNASNALFQSTGHPQLDALFDKKRKKGTTECSKINAYTTQIPMPAIPSLILCLTDIYKKHLQTCEELNLPKDLKTGIDKPDDEHLPPIQYIK